MRCYPKDCEAKAIGRRARAIFPNKLNLDCWEFHEETGADNGIDMIIEYIKDGEFKNNRIYCQIKGTTILESRVLQSGYITYPLEIKTINYALGCNNAFILVVVDVNEEEAYYLPIQDFFIANPKYFDKLENNQCTVNLRVPLDNIVSKDLELPEIAKSIYIRKSDREIEKISIS